MVRETSATAARPRTLALRFRKSPDGQASLTCTRGDGSTTWQKQHGASARFFPRHDLTHFAVETVLGLRNGFYGMVAEGWDITDFGTPWPRGPMPEGADLAEVIVGLLDLERASGTVYTADDYREKVSAYYDARGISRAVVLDEADLSCIRRIRDELFARLDATLPGEALELTFVQPDARP